MYHPPSKRKQILQRAVIYSLMSVTVVGLVVVLVFIMLGYQFNRSDGSIEQGGLVQFDSRPTGGKVSIDGVNFGTRTPSKTTLSAGQHFVTMQRDGYKNWQKSVDVLAGEVLWLNYTRFIPTELTPASVADFSIVSSTSVSPDSKWMAIKENPNDASILLVDIADDTVKRSALVLPAASYTASVQGKTHSFSLVKWDPDSRYILVKHIYDDTKIEWIVVDTQDINDTQNVTKLLSIDASKVVFSGDNPKVLYAQIGSDVRRVDVGSATLSRPLASNVAEFSVYEDSTIVFSSLLDPETKKRTVGYYDQGSDKTRIVRTYTDDGISPVHIALGEYFSETYFAVSYGDKIDILKGDFSNPSKAKQIATMSVVGGAQYLTISTDGRFVVAQRGGTLVVNDLELNKSTTTEIKGVSEVTDQFKWLDTYTVWSDRDGMVRLYEFDGANQHNIMQVTPGFNVTLNPNAKYMYGIIKSDDGMFHLQRVKMIL
jgi:PEGA domain-containing protein